MPGADPQCETVREAGADRDRVVEPGHLHRGEPIRGGAGPQLPVDVPTSRPHGAVRSHRETTKLAAADADHAVQPDDPCRMTPCLRSAIPELPVAVEPPRPHPAVRSQPAQA